MTNFIFTAPLLTEYGADKEGYWTGDRFMQQVEFTADIAETRYDDATTHTLVWLFDQSSRHRKMDELALVSSKVLVKDGGPRRVRETTWAGQPQPMVNGGGMAKGLTTILHERGINTHNMRADDMRVVLQNHEDFRTEKSIICWVAVTTCSSCPSFIAN